MARLIKQYKSFQDGMTPYPNIKGIKRVEHFDVVRDTLAPHRGISLSLHDNNNYSAIYDIIKISGVTGATSLSNLFALGKNFDRFIIGEWDITTQKWSDFKSSASDSNYALSFHYYDGKFIGLTNGSHLWTLTSSAVNLSAVALSYTDSNPSFITHSKDDLCYIGVDNKIYSYNGTTVTLGVTLPASYLITSINETGDYILIIGYDSTTFKSTAYKWDRDSSLETLTAKYDLGYIQARHSATLGGVDFTVSLSWESSNTSFVDKRSLIIGYINQDNHKVLSEYKFSSISLGRKYTDVDNLYFTAVVRFLGSSTSHNVLFRLNANGKLFIELNLDINDTNNYNLNGFIKDGDGFWIGKTNSDSSASCGYHSKEAYDVESIIEFNADMAEKETHNLDTVGGVVSFEPLTTGQSIVVKTKADHETDWTTVRTLNTVNSVKESFVGLDISTAKKRYWQLISNGGAEINSFQIDYEEIKSEEYE